MTSKLPPVVLFGASQGCINFLEQTKKRPGDFPYQFLAVADNDKMKHNQCLGHLPIISPDAIDALSPVHIIITSTFAVQIRKQLVEQLGFNAQQISQAPKYALVSNKKFQPFSEPENRCRAEALLQWLIRHFNEQNIDYFIDHGTLLGLIRDGGILPWDDDIDLSMSVESLPAVRHLLQTRLAELCRLLDAQVHFGERPKSNNVIEAYLEVVHDGELLYIVSIKTIQFKNGEAWQSITKAPEHHFRRADMFTFWNLDIRVPHDTEAYLTLHYGDWRTPKKNTSFLDLGNYVEPKP